MAARPRNHRAVMRRLVEQKGIPTRGLVKHFYISFGSPWTFPLSLRRDSLLFECCPMFAKRNLLLGILALQNNFITRAQLLAAFNTWVEDKTKVLGVLLLEQKALRAEQHVLLEALVAEHLRQHDGDADKSLAALSSVGSARRDLASIADPDV